MTLFVPRYSPSVLPAAWLRWLMGTQEQATDARAANLVELGSFGREAIELGNARQGLALWLERIRRDAGSGEVLVPAQVCSVVREAIRRTGHTPRFLDADGTYPTPSPQQYEAAISPATRAAIVAPLYGYLQPGWMGLLRRDVPVALDLAQGMGLRAVIADLLRGADAVVYSFGLGKGLDSGGGLLLTNGVSGPLMNRVSAAPHLGALGRSIALRTAVATGVYRLLVKRLDAVSEGMKEDGASFEPYRLKPAAHLLWLPKIARFREEVERARERAEIIRTAGFPGMKHLESFTSAESAPLRQVIRVRDAAIRDRLVADLRRAGVDCAPAGEPLPEGAETHYPNAAAFGADAIRLPFLGRLSEREFGFVRKSLESALVRLSH